MSMIPPDIVARDNAARRAALNSDYAALGTVLATGLHSSMVRM